MSSVARNVSSTPAVASSEKKGNAVAASDVESVKKVTSGDGPEVNKEGDEDDDDDEEEDVNKEKPIMFPNLPKPYANVRATSTAAQTAAAHEDPGSDDNEPLVRRIKSRRAATTTPAPSAKKTKKTGKK